MADSASIVADLRRAVELLGALDDPAATRTAQILTRWLSGKDFDRAAELVPGWRSHLRLVARDRALGKLVTLRADLDAKGLADWIADGVPRVDFTAIRPDGADGHLVDLARAGRVPGRRQLRRLIAEGRGHCADGMATAFPPALPKPEE